MCVIAWPGRNSSPGFLLISMFPQGVRFPSSAGSTRRVRVSPPPGRRTWLLPVRATFVLTSRPSQIRLAGYRARGRARTRSQPAGSRTRAISAGRGCLAGSALSIDRNHLLPPAKEVNQGAFLRGETKNARFAVEIGKGRPDEFRQTKRSRMRRSGLCR